MIDTFINTLQSCYNEDKEAENYNNENTGGGDFGFSRAEWD